LRNWMASSRLGAPRSRAIGSADSEVPARGTTKERRAAPEAILRRVEWAYGQAGRGAGRDAASLAEAVMGPLIQPETLRAASRAGSAREALTLVLTSPEFQRR
jgi:uncharacterized protein (DUF1800 family)